MNEIASIESVAEAIYDLRSQIELVVDKKEIKPIFQIQYITLCVFQVEIFAWRAELLGLWSHFAIRLVTVECFSCSSVSEIKKMAVLFCK